MKQNPHIKKHIQTEDEMLIFGSLLAHSIEPGTIIFLYGHLGTGKTTLTRGFLRGLGYQAKVKSPTYTVVEGYSVSGKNIFHFDLYRVMDPEELEHIGIREYFSQDAICLIEWPEKGQPLLPTPDLACYITFSDQGREISIEALSFKGEEILKRL